MKKRKREEKKKKNKFSTDSFYRFLIFFISFLIILAVITFERRGDEWKLNVKVGEPAPKDIYSPFSFTFVDEKKTNDAKQFAVTTVLPVCSINEDVNKSVLERLNAFFSDIANASIKDGVISVSENIRNVLSDMNLRELLGKKDVAEFTESVNETVTSILREGVISLSKKVEFLDDNNRAITLLYGENEVIVNVYDVVSLNEINDRVNEIAIEKFPKKRRLRGAFTETVNNFVEVNMVYDADETQLRKDKTFTDTPDVEIHVKKNEIILSRGSIITPGQLMRLKEIEKKITKKKVTMGVIGVGVVALLFVIILALYLSHFEPKLYYSFKDIVVINTTIICTLMLNKALLVFMQADIFFLPTSFTALLLAILIKPRIGIFVSIGMAALSGVMTQNNPLILITTLFASIMGVYAIIDVRRRSQFFIVGALIGLINFSLMFGYSILQEMTLIDAFYKARIGILNGVFITVLLWLTYWFL